MRSSASNRQVGEPNIQMLPALERHGAVMRSDSGYWINQIKRNPLRNYFFAQYPGTGISPRRRLYPPACKPYGLEAEPEASIGLILLRQESFKI